MKKFKSFDPATGLTRTYDGDNPKDFARLFIRTPYAWPGGYELYLVTDDGGLLCLECVRNNYEAIYKSTKGDGWFPAGITGDHQMDENSNCDNCSKRIGPNDPRFE